MWSRSERKNPKIPFPLSATTKSDFVFTRPGPLTTRSPFSGRPSLTGHCGHGWTCSLPRIVGVPKFLEIFFRGCYRPGRFFGTDGCARGGISMPASVDQSRGVNATPGPGTDGPRLFRVDRFGRGWRSSRSKARASTLLTDSAYHRTEWRGNSACIQSIRDLVKRRGACPPYLADHGQHIGRIGVRQGLALFLRERSEQVEDEWVNVRPTLGNDKGTRCARGTCADDRAVAAGPNRPFSSTQAAQCRPVPELVEAELSVWVCCRIVVL